MELLLGKTAKTLLEAEVKERMQAIQMRQESVRIALFRVGSRDDDCQYERTILRACDRLGLVAESTVLDESVPESSLYEALQKTVNRSDVDGILLFRPLPKALQTERIRTAIPPEKDIDGALLEQSCFHPCTPEACMHLLRAYGIDPSGKHCVVVGRSPVVGKPLANLLKEAGADVTVCHTQTPDVPAETRKAEILFVACGKSEMIDRTYLTEGQTIIDVGFHSTGNGFCGDVKAEDAKMLAAAYTPVPGGVGAVTLSVLLLHAVQAHERNTKNDSIDCTGY